MGSLRDTNARVQTSANLAQFLIKEITSATHFIPEPPTVYDAVEDFVYHYENYCVRAFAFREKMLLYLNAALKIDFPTDDVRLTLILKNAITKKAGLVKTIEKFDSRSPSAPMGQLIKDRNSLTHKLHYGTSDKLLRPASPQQTEESDFRVWFREWSKNVEAKAKLVDSAERQMDAINHALAEKVVAYREKTRPSAHA